MQQVQDEKAKFLQALAELEHSTVEINQSAGAQQELEKANHEEADSFTAQAVEQVQLEQSSAPRQPLPSLSKGRTGPEKNPPGACKETDEARCEYNRQRSDVPDNVEHDTRYAAPDVHQN